MDLEHITSHFKRGTLTKLSDDVFEGNHPNRVYEGRVEKGLIIMGPLAGVRCVVGDLRTSMVTEILEKEENKTKFKTLYSTYLLEYETNNL